MPVMKNIGVKDTIIARVDIMTGGITSFTAIKVADSGSVLAHLQMSLNIIHIGYRIIYNQTQTKDQGKQSYPVDSIAKYHIGKQSQCKTHRNGKTNDQS